MNNGTRKTYGEDWVKKKVKAAIAVYHPRVKYTMPNMNIYGASGVSDFLVNMDGLSFAVETKKSMLRMRNEPHIWRRDTIPTFNQTKYMQEQREARGVTLAVDQNNYGAFAACLYKWFNEVMPNALGEPSWKDIVAFRKWCHHESGCGWTMTTDEYIELYGKEWKQK